MIRTPRTNAAGSRRRWSWAVQNERTHECEWSRRTVNVDHLRPPISPLPLPRELLKPMLHDDELVRHIRVELANHQEPLVIDADRVLRGVLVRLVRGGGKKNGSSPHRECRRHRDGYRRQVSGFVAIE